MNRVYPRDAFISMLGDSDPTNYQERVGIASEVLDAETLLVQTKTDYFRALYDYQTAMARLQNALGEL